MAWNFSEWSYRFYLNYKTWRFGVPVGRDQAGNRYYRDRRSVGDKRERRWVVFDGGLSDASRVPPEWHGWLHHQQNEPPPEASPLRRPWQREHIPNLTGTTRAYKPPGATERGGQRAPATGDYEPWTPN